MRKPKRLAVAALAASLALPPLAVAAPAPVALKTIEFGRGPTVVLVHSVGSGRMAWMPTARKLLSSYHVVLVDLPGHGDSPMIDPFSYEAAAEAIDQVLAKQKAESTIVVGQGAGGMMALLALHAHPDHARGLVAIDAGLKFPIPIPDQQKKGFLEYLDGNFDDFLKRTSMQQGRDSAQGVIIHAQASLVPRVNMITYIRSSLDNDATGALKGFPLPILFIGSEKGWPPSEDWATCAKKFGWDGATTVDTLRVRNSAALIASDQPDTLALAISNFATRAFAAKK